jgi:hypothetical protein
MLCRLPRTHDPALSRITTTLTDHVRQMQRRIYIDQPVQG